MSPQQERRDSSPAALRDAKAQNDGEALLRTCNILTVILSMGLNERTKGEGSHRADGHGWRLRG